ncbi:MULTISPECIES: hypothetical protein [Burkholderia]|uniref:hypothetical protein n=1 Tax=Burkholderia TaxID=32008 RepID=UPI0011AF9DAA|nr:MULTISPECIES: hypothetical protein [unclassified Burkholderia]
MTIRIGRWVAAVALGAPLGLALAQSTQPVDAARAAELAPASAAAQTPQPAQAFGSAQAAGMPASAAAQLPGPAQTQQPAQPSPEEPAHASAARGTLAASWMLSSTAPAQPTPPADASAGIPIGPSMQTVDLGGTSLPVFTYRPARCAPSVLLLVFHGMSRNGAEYRDAATPLAERICAIAVAPQFDESRFPDALYQHGGVTPAPAFGSMPAAPPSGGTRPIDLVPRLADWARRAAGAPALPVVLLGHSAGAQFLDRVAAYSQPGAARIVLANPGTWVMPNSTAAPYGFGGLGSARRQEAALRAYLAQPVTVLLGMDDVKGNRLAHGVEADAQGPTRLARGLHAFQTAQAAARSRGWPFGWRLLEVRGVGHDVARMFASDEAVRAVQSAHHPLVCGDGRAVPAGSAC